MPGRFLLVMLASHRAPQPATLIREARHVSKRRPEGRSSEAAAVYGQLLAAGGGRMLAAPPAVAAGLAVAYVLAGANDAAEALLARCEAEEAAAAADWAARRTHCIIIPLFWLNISCQYHGSRTACKSAMMLCVQAAGPSQLTVAIS